MLPGKETAGNKVLKDNRGLYLTEAKRLAYGTLSKELILRNAFVSI